MICSWNSVIIFINNFDKDINGTVLKFADDSKLFVKANCVVNCKRIQDDLDKLKQWSDLWQMQFNVDKCKAIHFQFILVPIIPSSPITLMAFHLRIQRQNVISAS